MTAYQSKFDADGNPMDPNGAGGLSARLVPTTEIAANGYDLNIGKYI
ncbi:hypothetical protein ACFXGR_51870 [Streptomyces mirabilis]